MSERAFATILLTLKKQGADLRTEGISWLLVALIARAAGGEATRERERERAKNPREKEWGRRRKRRLKHGRQTCGENGGRDGRAGSEVSVSDHHFPLPTSGVCSSEPCRLFITVNYTNTWHRGGAFLLCARGVFIPWAQRILPRVSFPCSFLLWRASRRAHK